MNAVDGRDVIIAYLNEGPPAEKAHAYSRGQLGRLDKRPTMYNEVLLMEKLSGVRLAGGRMTAGAWRLLTRAVAESEDNAEEMRRRAAVRLEEHILTVGGIESTALCRAVSDNPISEQNGWWSGPTEWSFYL